MERVQKLLSNYGYCSRRKAEELIKEGKVKVNDKVVVLGDKASSEDVITVNGEVVSKEKKVYLLFNKPTGCVTAVTDTRYKTVMDYIKIKERVFPVGRLDYNTSGLLLLTNDGDFANKVMHPRYETTKTYLVKISRPLAPKEVKTLENGIELEDGKTSPATITTHSPTRVEIKIHEGKNRIIRRMFEALEIKVFKLERIKIGKLALGNLKAGKYRELNSTDLKKIFE